MSPTATAAPLPITLRRVAPADASALLGGLGPHPVQRLRRRPAAMLGSSVGAAHQGGGVGTALMQAARGHADRWAQRLRLEPTVFVDDARVDGLAMARLHPHPPAALGLPAGEPE